MQYKKPPRDEKPVYWLFVWCFLIGVAKLKVGG